MVLLVTGCSQVTPEQAFQPVQTNVATISGHKVTWNQGTIDDQKVEADVHRLLAVPLSADAAAQVALLNNPDLQATFEDIGISQADLVQAGLLKNPILAASWRFPDQPPGLGNIEYSVAQDFLNLIMLPIKTKVAKTNLEATQDRVTHEVIRLISEVKEAFYTYQSEIQLEQKLNAIIQADQAAVDLAKRQHDGGNLNDAAYANIQAQVPRTALAEARREKISTREKLNRLMGLWGEEINWTAQVALPPLPEHDPSLNQLESLAISQRRDLLAKRKEVDSIGEMLALKANTRFLPVSIYIGVDTERESSGQRVTGPTLDTELPIFDQGQGEMAKLSAQYRHAERQLQSLVVRIRSEVRESRDTLKIDREQVTYYQTVLLPLNQPASPNITSTNTAPMNASDALLAKQRELDTEHDYIVVWRDYWITRTQLEEAVGGNLQPSKNPGQTQVSKKKD